MAPGFQVGRTGDRDIGRAAQPVDRFIANPLSFALRRALRGGDHCRLSIVIANQLRE